MNKKVFVAVLIVFTLLNLCFTVYNFYPVLKKNNIISPLGKKLPEPTPTEKPLKKYAYEILKTTVFEGSEIELDEVLQENPQFSSYLYFFETDGKKASGLINVPKNIREADVIVMFRGYVDRQIYTTGEGTRRTGEEFAKNGFVTLAPDFLGYGKSASPSANAMEERFETYTTALEVLASVKNLNKALSSKNLNTTADSENIGIWGHSNGGHIALAILEITEKEYPTVLWAPVSKPFPYSILYFTDEFDDHGKALRKLVADFETDYDADKYSPANYLKWINAPIQLHQGVNDEAVPVRWSDQLNRDLRALEKDITYFTYKGENHNFLQGSWPQAVLRSVEFYRDHFE